MSVGPKMVLLGATGAGKTALTIQFASNHFVEDYDPTIEDVYRKSVIIDGLSCIVEILDTAVDMEHQPIRYQHYQSAEGFIFVYAMNCRKSFDELGSHYEAICRVKDCSDIPIVVVGNKCDLSQERVVKAEEGEELAQLIGGTFFETSAKYRTNVEESIYHCARGILQRKNLTTPERRNRK